MITFLDSFHLQFEMSRHLQTTPISRRWSKAQAPVVPSVAQTWKKNKYN